MFAVSVSPGESLALELQACAWGGQKVDGPVPSSKTGMLKDLRRATSVDGPGSETIAGTFPG